jgi:hypothetical protein
VKKHFNPEANKKDISVKPNSIDRIILEWILQTAFKRLRTGNSP